MPVVLTTSAPSREMYEQILAIVGEDTPPGCIVHTASEVGGEVRVVDVWETRQHIEDFFAQKLGPAFAQVGLDPGPPELYETFRIERG
jgi:hypothetical protein